MSISSTAEEDAKGDRAARATKAEAGSFGLAQLPHRPPFVFVRHLLHCEPGERAEGTALFSSDDPMFAGHFPGNPLVPGVILTEALAQVAGIAAASGFSGKAAPRFLLSAIRGMKFFAPARPGEEILLRAEKRAQVGELWQFQVDARVSDRLVAEGQIVLNRVAESSSAALE